MKFGLRNALTMVAIASVLTACGSGEPSIADIGDALIAAGLANKKDSNDMVKIGCKEDGKNSYRCDVGSKDNKGMAMPFRFVKTEAGWRLSGT